MRGITSQQVKTILLGKAKCTKGAQSHTLNPSPFSGLVFSAAGRFNVWRGKQNIIVLCLAFLFLTFFPAAAQDGFNLPSELYVLTNSGTVERYGLGAEGVRTVTPTDQFVLDMAVAPDGNWLAYRTQDGLMLVDMFTQESAQIEGATSGFPPLRGRGETMAWTADGSALAYTMEYGARVYFNTGIGTAFADIPVSPLLNLSWSPDGSYLAGEAENNIWWIYKREGNTMTLVSAIPQSFGTAWMNDSTIAFVPDTGGLIAMDMADGNRQTPILNERTRYHLPYLMPDGTVMVYAQIEENQGQLMNVDLSAGEASEFGDGVVDLVDVRWAPSGNVLVAFQGGALALVGRVTGERLTLPIPSAVAYGWGPLPAEGVTGVELPFDGFFIANDLNGVGQVWRLPHDGSLPEQVTSAPAGITVYDISPDRRTLAYVSEGKLWSLALSGASEPVNLIEVDTNAQFAFSSDSRNIIYALNTEASQVAENDGLWSIPVEGGEPTQILAVGDVPVEYHDLQYAPNFDALLVRTVGPDGGTIGVVDVASGALNPLSPYAHGRWLRDGRVVAYDFGYVVGSDQFNNGVWVLSPNDPAQAPAQVMPIAQNQRILALAETRQSQLRVLLRGTTPGPVLLQVADVSLGGTTPTLLSSAGFMASPQFSPDGSVVAGYTHPGGALVLYNLEDGRRVSLLDPLAVTNFRWSPS